MEAPLERIWEFEIGGDIIHKTLAGNSLILTGKDSSVHAVEAASGKEKWKFMMSKPARPGGSLVLANEILYVLGEDRSIYAIDTRAGERLWQFSAEDNIWYPPVVSDKTIYIVSKIRKDGVLYSLDAETGSERWRYLSHQDIGLLESGHGSIFFSTKDKRVFAIDVDGGEVKWEFRVHHRLSSSPVSSNGKLLIYGDENLYALDADSGMQLWKIPAAVPEIVPGGWNYYRPTTVEGSVLLPNELTLVDVASGLEKARLAPGMSFQFPIDSVGNGLVYVRLASGCLGAFDLSAGGLKWYAVIEPKSPFNFGYSISGNSLFATAYLSCKAYCINTQKFARRWEFPDLGTPPLFLGDIAIMSGVWPMTSPKKVWGYVSVKDPASKALLEPGEEVAVDPVFSGSVLLLAYSQSHFGNRGGFLWPPHCCLCGGPVEKHVNLMESRHGAELRAEGVPYCDNCHRKLSGLFKKEKPGVVITDTAPPTFSFRNEKYWAMFMEANHAR